MSRSRAVHYLLCFVLIFSVLGGLAVDRVALAQEEPGGELKLSCQYPVLRAKSGESFEFKVELNYLGKEDRTFELKATGLEEKNWATAIRPMYDTTEISAIRIKGEQTYPESVKVLVVPLPWALPEPGEYVVTFEAGSGDIKETIKLTAVITAKYEFTLNTETGRLNTEVTAGEENHFGIRLANSGSAAIENITFGSTKLEGWSITYNPEKIDILEAGLAQDVDVIIKPPPKTIAGDYAIDIRAASKQVRQTLTLRVTVLTPTIWGWVGIVIVVLVIVGLAILFRQLGRR